MYIILSFYIESFHNCTTETNFKFCNKRHYERMRAQTAVYSLFRLFIVNYAYIAINFKLIHITETIRLEVFSYFFTRFTIVYSK